MSIKLVNHRGGWTIPELLLVVVLIGLTTIGAISGLGSQLDQIATRDAARAAGALISRARDDALALHTPVTVNVDTANAVLELRARGALFATEPLGQSYGVRVGTNRDQIVFDVRGLGYGAANLTLVTRRGRATDTVVVSRLGRVRY
ncbi:MAG: hypothetical protein H0W68_10865 [Gemmatimonadaceae bacterium]|nr:hypothetical protein [Gemmatimonadaceae bacterium]